MDRRSCLGGFLERVDELRRREYPSITCPFPIQIDIWGSLQQIISN
jgi:hypothetical protein